MDDQITVRVRGKFWILDQTRKRETIIQIMVQVDEMAPLALLLHPKPIGGYQAYIDQISKIPTWRRG
jgi:hypothetical protein